jgi:hypothetical protein
VEAQLAKDTAELESRLKDIKSREVIFRPITGRALSTGPSARAMRMACSFCGGWRDRRCTAYRTAPHRTRPVFRWSGVGV